MMELEGPLEFALDVGTRKVAGLLVAKGGKPEIRYFSVKEHGERAMLDGQVHFIEKAAAAVREVKEDLEGQAGQPLEEAHVAVAGRSLKSLSHRASLRTRSSAPLSREQVLALELEAVQGARLAAGQGTYCVGYSASQFVLDGMELSDLEGHAGDKAELTVLATFLPKLVLDSLSEVLRLAGLKLASLTLEPIAAAAIALPPDLRRLNLAMVDVGAGTSDIAVSRAGRIEAFAMADLAGDEVTEALADAFLLDFAEAEKLKRTDAESLGMLATDLFGNKKLLEPGPVWAKAQDSIEAWAGEVAKRILELNAGKPPQAVLLVGGGSQSPNMDMALAQKLGIDTARVGRRPASLQQAFVGLPQGLNEAWATTPLGIALMAVEKRGLPFAQFRVNGAPVQALHFNQAFSAMDALVASGRDLSDFYAKPGLAITYEFNGQLKTAIGEAPEAAKIYVNGSPAEMDSRIQPGDSLTFESARSGGDGKIRLSEVLKAEGPGDLFVEVNGERKRMVLDVRINGAPAQGDPWVRDRDRIDVAFEVPLGSLLAAQGCDLQGLISRSIALTFNGEPRVITQRNYRLGINGREAPLEALVRQSDKVEFEPGVSFQERLKDLISLPLGRPLIKVKVNGEWREVQGSLPRMLMNGREVSPDEFLIDGAEIRLLSGEKRVSVVELLAQLPFDSARLKASTFELKVNGEPAPFHAAVSEGDEVQIRFEEGRPSGKEA